jgi:DMSO reductase family type II enzyme heme b subunit
VRDETIRNIYARLSIGIPSTPMPAHRAVEEGNEDPVSLEDRWHIANYVYSLRESTPPPSETGLITAERVEGGLPANPGDEQWEQIPATTLNLVPNIIKEERLFTPLNDAVTVRVAYNEQEIAFLLEVDDRTMSLPGDEYFTELMDENLEMHPDALAIELPREESFETDPVVVKPLYRHGDAARPATIWYWNAGSIEPEMPARAALIDAGGPDKELKVREADASLAAQGEWKDGRWRVLMRRSRWEEGGDVGFEDGRFIPIAFANWDGSNGEVASKHTLTTWYWLTLPPPSDMTKTFGLPAGIGILVFLAGFSLVRAQRKS